MSRTPRQRAIKRCDDAFSRFIRRRDGGRCYTCGSEHDIQCGHLFPRGRFGTRWEPRAARAQCERCNSLHECDPEPYRSKWIGEHGERAYEELERRSWKIARHSVDDIEILAKQFNAMAARVEESVL